MSRTARRGQRRPIFWQVLSALFLLNAIGALLLAVAIVASPRRYLPLAGVLSLLFMVGTLLSLVLALTAGLFGIREQLNGELVVATLIVESVGSIVLAVTTAQLFRLQRGHRG